MKLSYLWLVRSAFLSSTFVLLGFLVLPQDALANGSLFDQISASNQVTKPTNTTATMIHLQNKADKRKLTVMPVLGTAL